MLKSSIFVADLCSECLGNIICFFTPRNNPNVDISDILEEYTPPVRSHYKFRCSKILPFSNKLKFTRVIV